jgi:hypothetical protein
MAFHTPIGFGLKARHVTARSEGPGGTNSKKNISAL